MGQLEQLDCVNNAAGFYAPAHDRLESLNVSAMAGSSDSQIVNVCDDDGEEGFAWNLLERFCLDSNTSNDQCMLISASSEHCTWEGVSLHNALLCRRAASEEMIEFIKKFCNDDSWKLLRGDIVCVNSCRWPFRCVREGWGDYEKQIRVSRLTEDVGRRESGRWVSSDACARLEVNDRLDVLEDIEDAMENSSLISKGTKCKFLGWDYDGDVAIFVNGARHIIFMQDLDKLSLI